MKYKRLDISTDRIEIDADTIMCGADPDEVKSLIKNFHYSKRMPAKIQRCFVIRKRGGFTGYMGEIIAAAIVSISSAAWAENVLEMSRIVRKPTCTIPMTKLISFACKQMAKQKEDILIISYADKLQNHHGGLYQAAGWFYHGERPPIVDGYMVNDKYIPKRTCNVIFGTSSQPLLEKRFPQYTFKPRLDQGKHLYWRPLNRAGLAKAARMGMISVPYPKPNAACLLDERSQPREPGANPGSRSTSTPVSHVPRKGSHDERHNGKNNKPHKGTGKTSRGT